MRISPEELNIIKKLAEKYFGQDCEDKPQSLIFEEAKKGVKI